MQHVMFKVIMGKYPPPLVEILSEVVPGEPKACLDLGCGSGSWYVFATSPRACFEAHAIRVGRIMDVARDFPNCQAVAVDLVPMQAEFVHPCFSPPVPRELTHKNHAQRHASEL